MMDPGRPGRLLGIPTGREGVARPIRIGRVSVGIRAVLDDRRGNAGMGPPHPGGLDEGTGAGRGPCPGPQRGRLRRASSA